MKKTILIALLFLFSSASCSPLNTGRDGSSSTSKSSSTTTEGADPGSTENPVGDSQQDDPARAASPSPTESSTPAAADADTTENVVDDLALDIIAFDPKSRSSTL